MDACPVGRFAPSPSGRLHLGNLLSSLLAWLDVRCRGGRILLRMEDLDPARSREDYAQAIADDLRWLGLDWDAGYPDGAYRQSARFGIYGDVFASLQAQGLVYPCWCSRAQRLAASAPHPGQPGRDPGCRCAQLSRRQQEALFAQRPPAWKIRVPDQEVEVFDEHYGPFRQNLARDCGDFILRRADGVYAYQLAVSVDDALMGVTRVVRGRDLLESAPRQAWLMGLLGKTPPVYAHGPLLLGPSQKLSKRLGDLNTQTLRQQYTPEALLGRLAYLAGLLDEPRPCRAEELAKDFSWTRVTKEDVSLT